MTDEHMRGVRINLSDVVLHADLFARTEPAHKSELVDLLKKQGFIVAMVFFLKQINFFVDRRWSQ